MVIQDPQPPPKTPQDHAIDGAVEQLKKDIGAAEAQFTKDLTEANQLKDDAEKRKATEIAQRKHDAALQAAATSFAETVRKIKQFVPRSIGSSAVPGAVLPGQPGPA